MKHLPLFFDLHGRRALLVGGGTRAARKLDLLLRAGCRVSLFAGPAGDFGAEVAPLAEHELVSVGAGAAGADDFEGCVLAIGADEDDAENRRISELARVAGVPVNVPDSPELSDFIFPAVVDREPVTVAVSSGGAAPILTRILKARLETMIPAAYGHLGDLAGAFRARVMEAIASPVARRRFWENVLEGRVAEFVFSGQPAEARRQLEAQLAEAAAETGGVAMGEVYLVGAGPGDPDLVTFRALRLMQRADVVLYDRLIGDKILNLVRRDAERIYVGKSTSRHTVPQDELSGLLVKLAREGKRALRLKGGDPFLFGRGGEEIEALAAEGIPFQVVPGVTAAAGCAAYAGIPLTHRDHAQACVFVTGHGKDGAVDLDWPALIRPDQTVVVYMGLGLLEPIAAGFIEHGAAADTSVAVVERGTRPDQRVVIGTLADIAGRVTEAGLKSPSLIIVGSVVGLHKVLSWYDGA